METNWHTRVYLMGSVAACCLAGTASFFLFGRERKATKDQPIARSSIFVRLLEKTSWLLMVVGYLIYPVWYDIRRRTLSSSFVLCSSVFGVFAPEM
jgi:hypothetical protein